MQVCKLRINKSIDIDLINNYLNKCSSFADDSIITWVGFNHDIIILFDNTHVKANKFIAHIIKSLNCTVKRYSLSPHDKLFIVAQDGDLFQKENPCIKIIGYFGRYLVISKSPGDNIIDKHSCYESHSFKGNFFAIKKICSVDPVIPQRNLDFSTITEDFNKHLENLVKDKPSRVAFGDGYKKALIYIENIFNQIHDVEGHKYNIEEHLFDYTTRVGSLDTKSKNLILTKLGNGVIKQEILLVAHLDSINLDHSTDEKALAPGADDNGSGCAGIMVIADLLKNNHYQHDIKYIFFGAEEEGQAGSKSYIKAKLNNIIDQNRVKLVINLDMIAHRYDTPDTAMIEFRNSSISYCSKLAGYAAHFGLNLEIGNVSGPSDHESFSDPTVPIAVPSLLVIEAASASASDDPTLGANTDNRYGAVIHTEDDIISRENIHPDYAVKILKTIAAFIDDIAR